MKKSFIIFSYAFLLIAYATNTSASSIISGKITVRNEYGNDITSYCQKSIKKGGAYSQMAYVGSNTIEQITCINNYEVYRIKADSIKVKVSTKNSNVNFGSIYINLHGDGSYEVEGGNDNLIVKYNDEGWSRYNISNLGGGTH